MSKTKRGSSDASLSPHSSSTPPQTFPFAHPPPKSTSNKPRSCLRLSSRLLLQIQQLQLSSYSSSTRAIPILELYQPSSFGKSISLNTGSRKIHKRDIYLTQNEPYTHLRSRSKSKSKSVVSANGSSNGNGVSNGHGDGTTTEATNGTKPRSGSGGSSSSWRRKSKSSGDSSGDESEWKAKFRPRRRSKSKEPASASGGNGNGNDEDGDEGEVVAVIHTSPKLKSKTGPTPDAELFFPLSGRAWEADSTGPGRYRFRMSEGGAGAGGDGVVFEWEKRPPSQSSPRSGYGSAAAEKDGEIPFSLGVSYPGGETGPVRRPLAQLTRRGIHVGGLDVWQRELRTWMIDDGAESTGLYTLILTMGVWVARREAWVI